MLLSMSKIARSRSVRKSLVGFPQTLLSSAQLSPKGGEEGGMGANPSAGSVVEPITRMTLR